MLVQSLLLWSIEQAGASEFWVYCGTRVYYMGVLRRATTLCALKPFRCMALVCRLKDGDRDARRDGGYAEGMMAGRSVLWVGRACYCSFCGMVV